MDQLDEFQMRPLTPGLGFHKKPVTLKDHVAKAGLSREKVARPPAEPPPITGELKPRSKEEILNEIKEALRPIQQSRLTETLPRGPEEVKAMEPEITRTPPRAPVEIVNFEIPQANIQEKPSTGTRRGGHDAKVRELVPVSFSISSMILDGALVLALSMIFLMALVFATGVDVLSVMTSASREATAQLSLGVLYLAVWQMYVVVSRSFFGATLGEWTFDLQLGDNAQKEDAMYPARVLLRSLAVMFTGFVLLPVLSLILSRDLAAKVSGLQLYRKNV